MRAVVVSAFGGPEMLGVADVPEPQPGPGEVSVTVRFAGVNFTDVRNRQGDGLGQLPFIPGVEVAGTVRAAGAGGVRCAAATSTAVRTRRGDGLGQLPFLPGVEVAGTVRAVGAGVTSLRTGQPVAAFTRGHGYAEVATAAEAFTVPETEDLAGRPESAAMLITVPLVLMLLLRVARVAPQETVLLHSAAGGVGTVAGQLALRAGLR